MQSQGESNNLTDVHYKFVYRAEKRCKSSGAPAGAFPGAPPGPGWAWKGTNMDDFWSYPTPPTTKTKRR